MFAGIDTFCRALRRSKIFRSIPLHHLHPIENGIQLSCVGRCFNVYFDVNDDRVSNSIDSLEHRCNLACVSLFYSYYNGLCSSKIRGLPPVNHVFVFGRSVSGSHSYRDCNFLIFKGRKSHKIQKNYHKCLQVSLKYCYVFSF